MGPKCNTSVSHYRMAYRRIGTNCPTVQSANRTSIETGQVCMIIILEFQRTSLIKHILNIIKVQTVSSCM